MKNVQEILAEEVSCGCFWVLGEEGGHQRKRRPLQAADEEKWRREHEEMHAKHRGHDSMHAEMFIIFILAVAFSQIALVTWKRKHFRSYQLCTLIGMWLVPPVISVHKGFWRFVCTWLLFTGMTGYVYRLSAADHISGKTPR